MHPIKTIIYLCPESKKFASLFLQPGSLLLVGALYKLFKDVLCILVPHCLHSKLTPLDQKRIGANVIFCHIQLLKNIVQISIF